MGIAAYYRSLLPILLLALYSAGNTVLNGTTAILDANEEEIGISKAVTYPCKCNEGVCSCCTGNLMENFNFNIKQRFCTNLSFDPEDFTIGVKVAFNDRVFYQNRISGKNPPPMCLPIPRLTAARVCIRLTNVYFIGRNVHACVVFESQWNKQPALTFNFDCIRIGTAGVAIVRPEDGGGLPSPVAASNKPDDGIEDYDENVGSVDKPPKG